MTLPTLEIVDEFGNALPHLSDEPEVQYTRLYGIEWRVRLTPQWNGHVALLSHGQEPLLLTRIESESNLWHFPSEEELPRNARKEYKPSAGASGRLQIGLLDKNARPIHDAPVKHLDVFPGNISPRQLRHMVEDIGLLAISAESRVASSGLVTPFGEGQGSIKPGFEWGTGDGMLTTATAVQQLIQVLQQELIRLQTRPLRSIVVQVGPTRTDKVLNQVSALQKLYAFHDGRRTIVSQTRVESLDCSENQFVLFIIQFLEMLIPYVRSYLEGEPLTIPLFHEGFVTWTNQRQFFDRVQSVQRRAQEEREKLLEKRKAVAADLAQGWQWIVRERRNSFWYGVSQSSATPTCSLRLMGSPSYAAIYVQFQKLWGNTRTDLSRVFFLLENIQRGPIHPVWKIYELWCFVNLYYALALEIQGLHSSGPDLLEELTLENGELRLPSNTPFILKGQLPDSSLLQFTLWYEPKLKTGSGDNLVPDILVELQIRSKTMYFVFDCNSTFP